MRSAPCGAVDNGLPSADELRLGIEPLPAEDDRRLSDDEPWLADSPGQGAGRDDLARVFAEPVSRLEAPG